MEDKSGMEFWTFASDDPELIRFCTAHADSDSLYCILCVEECTGSYPAELMERLHLRNGVMLLIEPPMLPLYAHLQLKGRYIMLSEAFCATAQTKVLFKFIFFHRTPEGMIDGGNLTAEQRKCLTLLCEEYASPYDDLQPHILRNLVRNLLLFSDCMHAVYLTEGHLLGYALQLLDLLEIHLAQEKKKSFYAGKIGITETTLTHVLRVVFGKTFREIFVYQTLLYAVKMLLTSDKSITQIAHEFDYDISDFNKLFIKWKGIRPKDMREHFRNIVNQVEYAQS